MNDKNRNLVARIGSALVLLPLVLFLVAQGGWYTAALLAVAAAICASEYYGITSRPPAGAHAASAALGNGPLTGSGQSAANPSLRPDHLVGILAAALTPLYVLLRPAEFGMLFFWTTAALFVFAWVYNLLWGPKGAAAIEHAAHLLTGMLYAALGLAGLCAVRALPHGLVWVVSAMVITWANDTLAYFAGRFLGKHKLYERISPNKTWEGFVGGLVGSVGGMFIARAVFPQVLTPMDCVVLGLGGGVLGPLGDLCESMLKRAYGAKDSGKIIPGHGGLLDRVDALLFNGPYVLLYVTVLRALL